MKKLLAAALLFPIWAAAKEPPAEPPVASAKLIAGYQTLLRASQTCCASGIEYRMKQAKYSQDMVYQFLLDDANLAGFADRCLMTDDAELEYNFGNSAIAPFITETRDTCLCQRKTYFQKLLKPFASEKSAVWDYTDGLNRRMMIDIGAEIQIALKNLAKCPE